MTTEQKPDPGRPKTRDDIFAASRAAPLTTRETVALHAFGALVANSATTDFTASRADELVEEAFFLAERFLAMSPVRRVIYGKMLEEAGLL